MSSKVFFYIDETGNIIYNVLNNSVEAVMGLSQEHSARSPQ